MATRRPYIRRKPREERKNGAAMTIYYDLTRHGGVGEHQAVRLACRNLALKAGQHHTLMEDMCNGGTNAQRDRFNRKEITWDQIDADLKDRERDIEYAIRQAVLTLNHHLSEKVDLGTATGRLIHVQFSGDPRGYTVRLILPNGYKNGWGDGYGLTHNRQG